MRYEPIDEPPGEEPIDEPPSGGIDLKRLWNQCLTFVGHSALSILGIAGVLWAMQGPLDGALGYWIIMIGIVLFTIFFSMTAITAFRSLWNNWTPQQEQIATELLFGYFFVTPLKVIGIIIVIALVGVGLYSFYGWLATIPSWAAVIVVLLIAIYLKN